MKELKTNTSCLIYNLKILNNLFTKLLGKEYYKQESVERERVTTSFYEIGESKIELLEATNAQSPIAKFIEKKGEGIHHIAFDVEDIVAEIARLKGEGFVVLNEVPKKGADNKLVAFFTFCIGIQIIVTGISTIFHIDIR